MLINLGDSAKHFSTWSWCSVLWLFCAYICYRWCRFIEIITTRLPLNPCTFSLCMSTLEFSISLRVFAVCWMENISAINFRKYNFLGWTLVNAPVVQPVKTRGEHTHPSLPHESIYSGFVPWLQISKPLFLPKRFFYH